MAAQRGPRRSEGKERVWRRIVEDQPGSGESVREWCERHGVSEPSFYAWRRELRKRDAAEGGQTLMPVTIVPSATRAPLEICWPDGLVVRVSSGCDPQLLGETLRLLRSLDGETEPC